jgi:hypothetical protein
MIGLLRFMPIALYSAEIENSFFAMSDARFQKAYDPGRPSGKSWYLRLGSVSKTSKKRCSAVLMIHILLSPTKRKFLDLRDKTFFKTREELS